MAKKEEEQPQEPVEMPMPESPVEPEQDDKPYEAKEADPGPSTFDLQFPNAD